MRSHPKKGQLIKPDAAPRRGLLIWVCLRQTNIIAWGMYTNGACGINDGDSVLVTGGFDDEGFRSVNKGTYRYNSSGWIESLVDLNFGRFDHGCAVFIDGNNEKVPQYF